MSDSITQTAPDTAGTGVGRRSLTRFAEVAGGPVTWMVRAPVMLDVMGGIAELSGALTLAIPSGDMVRVGIAPRSDQRLRLVRLHGSGERAQRNGQNGETVWELASFYIGDVLADAATMRARIAPVDCNLRRAVLAAAYGLLSDKVVPHLAGGFTLLIDADRGNEADVELLAAVQGAAAAALATALDVPCDCKRIALACRAARGQLLGCPSGIMTQAGSLLGKPKQLLQVRCGAFDIGEYLPLPAGVTLLGVDSGVRHAQSRQKCCAALTAALMGGEIISRLMPVVCPQALWGGNLARVSITDFVDNLRNRIPTKLKGAQYLDRFGPIDSPWADVDPAQLYKVRSRAEHHIYEDDRVQQFVERLARARRSSDDQPLREAGELMYASHWSYGQRCGLGSIETDLLVNLLRAEGPDRGAYGARISGAGCGGTVIILMRNDDTAHDTVERVVATYQQRTGKTAALRPIADDDGARLAIERPS